jgi:hypothetical protein
MTGSGQPLLDHIGKDGPSQTQDPAPGKHQAMPQILIRSNHQARLPVILKRTQPNQVCPMSRKYHALRLPQPLQRNFPL